MPRPNFFLAGAAKCGTTSLHAYLSQHPDVFMCVPKEPRHFDTDMPSHPRYCVRDTGAYAALFDGSEDRLIRGEASPSYLVSETAPTAIREYAPEARVLISLRNPVDFMYSLHRQLVGSCNEDIHSFAQALAAEPDRQAGKRIPFDAHYPGHLRYRHNARFADQVKRYYDAFGRDRVRVVLMDDLATDPAGVYGDVLRFLGLPPQEDVDLTRRNTGESKRLRHFRLRRVMKRIPLVEKAVRSMPVALGTKMSDALVRITGEQVDSSAKMEPGLRAELTDEFRDEVQRLGELIGRDLSAWSY